MSGPGTGQRIDAGPLSGPGPEVLPPNPVFRFYAGGEGIDALRGTAEGAGAGAPEDWVGSVTTVLGQEREGLAALADGRWLRDVIGADPERYLGAEHVARFGSNPGLLVKLLDAGERLAVHYHPGRRFAREHLNSPFGKTECWIILSAEPGAHMNLGLREPIDSSTIARWAREQDSAEMLAALHTVPVAAGDVLFVPAGTLHTIGAGITLIELQEPADMSVVLESRRFKVDDGEATLYLGWPRVLPAAETGAGEPIRGPREIVAEGDPAAPASRSSLRRLLPQAADPYFRAEWLTLTDGSELTVPAAFSILIAVDGDVRVSCAEHPALRLPRGCGVLVPHGAGAATFSGDGTAIRCLPPAADSGEGQW